MNTPQESTYLGAPIQVIGTDPANHGNSVVRFLTTREYRRGEIVSVPSELIDVAGPEAWAQPDPDRRERGDRRAFDGGAADRCAPTEARSSSFVWPQYPRRWGPQEVA